MEDFTIEMLTRAYRKLSVIPLADDPYTFQNPAGDLVSQNPAGDLVYHAEFRGPLSPEFLLEEVAFQWGPEWGDLLASAFDQVMDTPS